MYAVFVEVDNSGEDRESRMRGLREDLAPAMRQTPGFRSGVFAVNEPAHTGFMVLVYETREHAEAIASRIIVGSHRRDGVTVLRPEVAEVAATAQRP